MAVPHILKYMRVPVYASKFTIAVLKEILIENGLNPVDFQLIVVDESLPIRFGKSYVQFINVSHSVPQSLAICIKTPDGNILYTGNFNFDQNGKNLYQTNVEALCKIANEGVLALLPECIATVSEVNRGSVNEFSHRLNRIFMNAGGRIIISLFSTNLQRIQQIVDMAVEYNKKVAILGRKTQRIVNIAINSGYLNVNNDCLVNLRYIDEKNKNNQSDLVVLVTGERHEPYFMLQRMCKKVDRIPYFIILYIISTYILLYQKQIFHHITNICVHCYIFDFWHITGFIFFSNNNRYSIIAQFLSKLFT